MSYFPCCRPWWRDGGIEKVIQGFPWLSHLLWGLLEFWLVSSSTSHCLLHLPQNNWSHRISGHNFSCLVYCTSHVWMRRASTFPSFCTLIAAAIGLPNIVSFHLYVTVSSKFFHLIDKLLLVWISKWLFCCKFWNAPLLLLQKHPMSWNLFHTTTGNKSDAALSGN